MVEVPEIEPGSEKESALGDNMRLPLLEADTHFEMYRMMRNIFYVFSFSPVKEEPPPPLAAVVCGHVRPTRVHDQGCRWVLVGGMPFGRLEYD